MQQFWKYSASEIVLAVFFVPLLRSKKMNNENDIKKYTAFKISMQVIPRSAVSYFVHSKL